MDLHRIIQAKKVMDEAKIPFCLMASTLLGIYRDGEPKGPIYEFAALASDITKTRIARLEKLWPQNSKRRSETGLAILDLSGLSENNNNFEVHLVYFKNGYGFHNLSSNECLVWPEYIWKKENWGKITWEGLEWNTPGDIENYLLQYYGKDWKTPQQFNWSHAPNKRFLIDLEANVEFLKKD